MASNTFITRSTARAKALLLIAAAASLGACSSTDKHVFVSTHQLPTTVTLVTALNQQNVLWSKEVPVGHELEVDFDRTDDEVEIASVKMLPAKLMKWEVRKIDESEPVEQAELQLPGDPVMLKVSYRKPERPATSVPAGK
jgi:hypothetical protein